MKKYEMEFKLEVVQGFLAGEGGAKLLIRRWSVPEEKVCTWLCQHHLHGIDGFKPWMLDLMVEIKRQEKSP